MPKQEDIDKVGGKEGGCKTRVSGEDDYRQQSGLPSLTPSLPPFFLSNRT